MKPDFSDERREHALSWIRGEGLIDAPLSEDAKVLAAIGLLICDDAGRMTETDLQEAMGDPSVVQAAQNLLTEAAG